MDQTHRLLGCCPTVVDEIASHLIEDPPAPPDGVEVLLSDAEERVPQWKRVQHARVEDNHGWHIRKISRGADATRYR